MVLAYIGLGSNVGDRERHLREAIKALEHAEGVSVGKVSPIYETTPVGYVDQPDFLNGVVEIETDLEPTDLLALTKSIELSLARQRGPRWGPRTIDLDILIYDNLELDQEHLRVPHPEVAGRAFVIVPLADLAPDLILPDGKTVKQLLRRLGQAVGVRLFKSNLQ